MTSEPEFHASVIIPVFNDRDGLLRTLDGLRTQTYPTSKFEVVVVDNDSEPAVKIEDLYSFHVKLLRCERVGSYAARNAGAAQRRSKVFAFIDADCVPEPDWLAVGLATLEQGGGQSIVGGAVRILPPEPKTGVGLYQYIVGFQQEENIHRKKFSVTANLFCYADHFRSVGPFEERLLSGGDLEWSWRARQRNLELVYSPDAVVKTLPRTSLRAAIRQARRVAGGRWQLRHNSQSIVPLSGLQPHRGGWKALSWIITHPNLSGTERLKVLAAAIIIRCATGFEGLRLRFGSTPERR